MSSEIEPALEALLLLATEPLQVDSLAEVLEVSADEIEQAMGSLACFYDETGRGFQLRKVAGGWQLATRPEQADLISQWVIEGQENKLTQASLETLTIIAYLQPVTRSRVSSVRGVNADGVIRTLIARGLVTQDDPAEGDENYHPGTKLLRTTDYFLERLGLDSLDDLPPIAPLLPDASVLENELANLAETGTEQSDSGQTDADQTDNDMELENESTK